MVVVVVVPLAIGKNHVHMEVPQAAAAEASRTLPVESNDDGQNHIPRKALPLIDKAVTLERSSHCYKLCYCDGNYTLDEEEEH